MLDDHPWLPVAVSGAWLCYWCGFSTVGDAVVAATCLWFVADALALAWTLAEILCPPSAKRDDRRDRQDDPR